MAAPSSSASSRRPGFLERHHFLLRRLHSLTGIVPVGVFVIFHLFTNAQMAFSVFFGEDKFQHEVEFIHNLPALLFLEVFGLWLPIAFHAGLGVVYTFTGRSNVRTYSYGDNARYTLQRVTGMIALIFIFLHIATLRWGWNIFGWYTPFYAQAVAHDGRVIAEAAPGEPLGLASASLALALQASWLVVALYIIGAYSVVYHWANGLWTAAISWGATTSTASMRRWGGVCAALGIALALFTATAIYGSLAYELSPQERAAFERLVEADGGDSAPASPEADEAGIAPVSLTEPTAD